MQTLPRPSSSRARARAASTVTFTTGRGLGRCEGSWTIYHRRPCLAGTPSTSKLRFATQRLSATLYHERRAAAAGRTAQVRYVVSVHSTYIIPALHVINPMRPHHCTLSIHLQPILVSTTSIHRDSVLPFLLPPKPLYTSLVIILEYQTCHRTVVHHLCVAVLNTILFLRLLRNSACIRQAT